MEQNITRNAEPRLYTIYGPGRSGTTWLGSIINSHPDIAYRFEPFRARHYVPRIKAVWEMSHANQNTKDELFQQLYQSLLPAHPLLDKPPFFKKNYTYLHGHKLAWNCARKIPQFNIVCERLYTPKALPPIVFKEIRWKIVKQLIEALHLRSVFILRSPYGTIASRLRGQRAGLMPTGRCNDLERVIKIHHPSLMNELPTPVSTLNDAQKNAVLWRLDAELMFNYLEQYPEHMLVIYEDLCARPFEVSEKVFEHFHIPWHQQTEEFIEKSTSSQSSVRSGERGIKAYFSVSRNTSKVVNQWRNELTETEKMQIDEIISPSKAYQATLNNGFWT